MNYFARINETEIVEEVIVVNDSDCGNLPFPESEPIGQEYIASIGIDGYWLQTSPEGLYRKQYAGITFTYDSTADVYIAPQPYPSWILDSNFDWEPPVPYPSTGGPYVWDESSESWIPAN